MGRRISISRPYAKVRGVERRLRALDKWADSFEGARPFIDARYMNYKIPVLDRLVEPPTTTPEIQTAALNSLLKAAGHLINSSVKDEVEYYRVAILVSYPGMFSSEVTVFYDPDYYANFFGDGAMRDGLELPSKRFDLIIPEGFVESGGLVSFTDMDDDGEEYEVSYEHWTIGQPLVDLGVCYDHCASS